MVKEKITNELKGNDTMSLIFRYKGLEEMVEDLDILIARYQVDQWDYTQLDQAKKALLVELELLYKIIHRDGYIQVHGSQRERMRRKIKEEMAAKEAEQLEAKKVEQSVEKKEDDK